MKTHLVASDIDRTLVFKERLTSEDGYQFAGKPRFITKRAVELIERIQEEALFGLFTGNREEKAKQRSIHIPHNYLVLEHGCVILQKIQQTSMEYQRDEEWDYKIKRFVQGQLMEYEEMLHRNGIQTAWEAREASFKVYITDRDNTTNGELTRIKELTEKHSLEITLTQNKGKLYALPTIGTKEKALQEIIDRENTLNKLELSMADTFGMGDDINDISMLLKVGFPMTLNSASQEIKDVVLSRRGYISPYISHEGASDMLNYILGKIIQV